MVRAFVLELLWLFFFPKERNGFPFFGHRCCPDHQTGYLVRILSHLVQLRHVLFECPSLICLSVCCLSLI